MAVSAYKGSQLKKNPLLGTALASDVGRGAEREGFRALHKEAVKSGAKSRSKMEGVLASRYARFAETGQRALGALGSQYQGIQGEIAGLRNPEKEYESQKETTKLRGQYEKASTEGKQTSIWTEQNVPTDFVHTFRREIYSGLSYRKQLEYKKNPQEFMKKYYGGKLTAAEGEQKMYEDDITQKTQDLEARGEPVLAEMERRTGALQERIANYNLFLGTQ